MKLTTQREWWRLHEAKVAECAALQAERIRQLALRVALRDGTGIRRFRQGAYTTRDMLMVSGVDSNRINRLVALREQVVPYDAQRVARLKSTVRTLQEVAHGRG